MSDDNSNVPDNIGDDKLDPPSTLPDTMMHNKPELPQFTQKSEGDFTDLSKENQAKKDKSGEVYNAEKHIPKMTKEGLWKKRRKYENIEKASEATLKEATSSGQMLSKLYAQLHCTVYGEYGLTKEAMPTLEHAFIRYLTENGYSDIPASIELTLAMCGYTITTAMKTENVGITKKIGGWIKNKFFKEKKEEQSA